MSMQSRDVTYVNEGVTGQPVIKVELEPLGNGRIFRRVAVCVFMLAFIATILQPSLAEIWRFDRTVLDGQWWRLFTYVFVHWSWWHVISNMFFCLLPFARVADMHFGRQSLIFIFVVCAVLSVLPELYLRPDLHIGGTSGGLFGLWGAQVSAAWRLREVPKTFKQISELLSFRALTAWFVLQVVIDQIVPNTAYWCHLGGFFCGLMLGFILPLCGGACVRVSRLGIAEVKKAVVHDVIGSQESDRFQSVEIALQPSFDPKTDCIVVEKDRLLFFAYRKKTVAAGTRKRGIEGQVLVTPTYIEGLGSTQDVLERCYAAPFYRQAGKGLAA